MELKKDDLEENRWFVANIASKDLNMDPAKVYELLTGLEKSGFLSFNKINLEDCVMKCFNDDEIVNKFNSINSCDLKEDLDYIIEVDVSTGEQKTTIMKFVEYVDLSVFRPSLIKINNNAA